MFLTANKCLVALQMGKRPRMRIIYNLEIETFFLQKRLCFLWRPVDYTFNVEVMKRWRGSYGMAWVMRRWAN